MTQHNTAVRISFNMRADMKDSRKFNTLFDEMAALEIRHHRAFNAQFSNKGGDTRVAFNLSGAFSKAHEELLCKNGVTRWEQKTTVEGYRQKVRQAAIDFVKGIFS